MSSREMILKMMMRLDLILMRLRRMMQPKMKMLKMRMPMTRRLRVIQPIAICHHYLISQIQGQLAMVIVQPLTAYCSC